MKLRRKITNSIVKNKFLQATVLAAGLFGCSENEKFTETFLLPYEGKVIKDDGVTYFQANTIVLGVKEGTTHQRVEEFITPYKGKITGWIKSADTFIIFLPADQREFAMKDLLKHPEVVSADRNYYSSPEYDNDKFTDLDISRLNCAYWSKAIKLSEGLDLIKNRKLGPSNIAVIEVGKFNIKDPQLSFVPEKYHADFSQQGTVIYSVDIGDFNRFVYNGEHATYVSLMAAAINDGKSINGVASVPNTKILPLQTGSLQINLGDVKEPNDIVKFIAEKSDDANVIRALAYIFEKADELNITVINMSLGKYKPYPFQISLILEKLRKKGIIVVASAGNDSLDASTHYPSKYEGVISVGATYADFNSDGSIKQEKRAYFSNYSTDKYITISAPGIVAVPERGDALEKVVRSIIGGEDYGCIEGTSFSAPETAGLIALIKALRPDADHDYVVKVLRDGADAFFNPPDAKAPQTTGTLILRINVKKTIEAVLATQTIGKCTTTNLPNSVHFYQYTGSHLLFRQDKLDLSTEMLYSEIDTPLSTKKINLPGSFIFFDPNEIGSRNNLLMFGSYSSGLVGRHAFKFEIGKDQVPLVKSQLSWFSPSASFGQIYLTDTGFVTNSGSSLMMLQNFETSSDYQRIKIPDQLFTLGENYGLIGYSDKKYVLATVIQAAGDRTFKYLMYDDGNGNWEKLKVPSYANCISNNALYGNVFVCSTPPNNLLLYDVTTKTSRSINISTDASIVTTTIWKNNVAAGLSNDAVMILDLNGNIKFTSSFKRSTNSYGINEGKIYLRDNVLIYAIERGDNILIGCKTE